MYFLSAKDCSLSRINKKVFCFNQGLLKQERNKDHENAGSDRDHQPQEYLMLF